MRAVCQRVTSSSVTVDGKVIGKIEKGYNILLGVMKTDTDEDSEYLANKVANLRVFSDEEGKLNKSILDISGQILVISQFTLCADARKQRRPSFMAAAEFEEGRRLYELFMEKLRGYGITVEHGEYGADMSVEIINDGPVTILLDSDKLF